MQLTLTGDQFSASDAHRWGLVGTLTEPGGALAGALSLAQRIAGNGPLAVAATKEIVANATDWTMEVGWVRQSDIMKPIFKSEDAREGARAFTEKRAPVWTGR